MITKKRQLEIKARRDAQLRGHTLEEFNDLQTGRFKGQSEAKCNNCDAWAQVNQFEDKIDGPAVVRSCPWEA